MFLFFLALILLVVKFQYNSNPHTHTPVFEEESDVRPFEKLYLDGHFDCLHPARFALMVVHHRPVLL